MIIKQGCFKASARLAIFVTLSASFFASAALAANCPHAFVGEATTSLLVALPADAGRYALWSPSAYAKLCDQKAKRARVRNTDDDARHIQAGEFVPLRLTPERVPPIELRIGSAKAPTAPNPIERRWVKATSEDYLFVSTGVANLSGIEHIGGAASPAIRSVALPAGRWDVRVYQLAAPAMARRDAKALYPPDLLVTLNPAAPGHGPYRTSEDTFVKAP